MCCTVKISMKMSEFKPSKCPNEVKAIHASQGSETNKLQVNGDMVFDLGYPRERFILWGFDPSLLVDNSPIIACLLA